MKYLFTFLILIVLMHTSQAQTAVAGSSPAGRISGTVLDSANRKALDYATVSLYISGSKTPVTGVQTDANGKFQLNNVKPGNYALMVSFVGYPTKSIPAVNLSNGRSNIDLGIIRVTATSRALNEVTVVGKTALVENKIDKVVYNVEKDITSAGGQATDVLRKVPMVSVDIQGNVSVRGDQNIRLLINGKTTGSSAANLADVLRSIPADQIKNIEVITSPSAKYDAEGSAGIINIITKKKNLSGFSGSINGGLGTRQNNGNVNLNYNTGKFHASVNFGTYFSWPQTSLSDFEQRIQNDTINTVTITSGSSRVTDKSFESSATMGFDLDTSNSINSTFRFSEWGWNSDGNSTTIAATPYSFSSNSKNSFGNFDWNLDYTHKFKQKEHELGISAQWSQGSGMNDFTNIYTGVFTNLRNDIKSTNNEYTFQLDYALPVSKTLKIEAGAKTILRRLASISDYYNSAQGADFVFDPLNSNTYNYDQNVYAGYSVATLNLSSKWTILAGVRNEWTSIHGDPQNASQALTPFDQHYNTFIPSLTIQRQFKGNNTLKLIYSKRIARPSLRYLNPFVNRSMPQSQSAGNPTLSPEVVNTYEVAYNAFFGSSSLTTSVYYRHTSGLIEGIASPISVIVNGIAQGGTLTLYQNIGTNNSIGTNIYGNVTPFKILTINGNLNAFTYKPDPAGIYANRQSQNGTYLMLSSSLRGTLTLPKNWLVEGYGWVSTSRRTIQGTSSAWNMYGFGTRKQFNDKKMSLGLNVTNPFAYYMPWDTKVSSPGFSQISRNRFPSRSFGITFSYNFGKVKFDGRESRQRINNDDVKSGGGQGNGGSSGS